MYLRNILQRKNRNEFQADYLTYCVILDQVALGRFLYTLCAKVPTSKGVIALIVLDQIVLTLDEFNRLKSYSGEMKTHWVRTRSYI